MYRDEEREPFNGSGADSDGTTSTGLSTPRDTYDEVDSAVRAELRRASILNPPDMPNGTLPNVIVSTYNGIVNPTFIDQNDLTTLQKKAKRQSITDPAVIKALPEKEVKELAKPGSASKQILLFMTGVLILGISPVIEQYALWDYELGKKNIKWILRTPFIGTYGISVIIGTLVSAQAYGAQGVKDCFDWKQIALGMPVAAAYTFADWAGQRVQLDLDGSLWKVMGQSKLIITAVVAWLVLGRRQNFTQWTLLITATLLIVLSTLFGLKHLVINNWLIFGLAWLSIVLGCCGGVASEYLLKAYKNHFVVQMSQSRLGSLICTLIFMCFEVTAQKQWHMFPFGGWHGGVVIFVVADLVKSWLSTLIIKSLDSVWKSLAIAAALGVTYIGSCMFLTDMGSPPFDLTQFTIILSLSTNILSYAASKRDEHKLMQLKMDAEKRLGEKKQP